MKKLLLTAVVAFCTLFASAQIMLVTTYDGDLEGSEVLTANAGIGYQVNDVITSPSCVSGNDGAIQISISAGNILAILFDLFGQE